MLNAKRRFHSILQQATISKGLYSYLIDRKVPIDASDLLRWQWVLAISALDKYIHDIVRTGMVQEFQGTRPKTEKYLNFRIDMNRYGSFSSSLAPEIDFENEIIRQHGILAFQHPDKISDALAYIWPEQHKWEQISQHMATAISAKDIRTKLNNIVVRRNQIVHEGDCLSQIIPFQQQPINEADVDDVISFVSELVDAISALI